MISDSEFPSSLPCRVLLVGSASPVAAALAETLAGVDGVELHQADQSEARERAAALAPSVVLQALSGYEDGGGFVHACRTSDVLKDVPLLVIAPHAEAAGRDAAFAAGATDYLAHLPARTELLARVRYHAEAHLARRQRDAAVCHLRTTEAALARVQVEIEQLAGLDALTGVASRSRFDHVAQNEWQRARRNGQPLSVLVCDVDHFEQFNERLGQDAGDLCLKKLAGLLVGQLKRPSDLAARYSGKAFAIMLPDTSLDGAVRVAEACRASLERLALSHPSPERRVVTMSIGVASSVPAEDAGLETLLERADEALEAAKARGRNRVMALRG